MKLKFEIHKLFEQVHTGTRAMYMTSLLALQMTHQTQKVMSLPVLRGPYN